MTGIGLDDTDFVRFADMFGCCVDFWPLKYLGLPLGGKIHFFMGSCGGKGPEENDLWEKNITYLLEVESR